MHYTYLAVLLGCLAAALPLEIALHTRVLARPLRLLAAVVPVFGAFLAWDLYAVHHRQWTFDPRQVLGVRLLGGLPVEEVAFFVVIPVCAILALEAVRLSTGWAVGDEAPDPAAAEPRVAPQVRNGISAPRPRGAVPKPGTEGAVPAPDAPERNR